MTAIDVDDHFRQALEHYAGGRLHASEGACRAILAQAPEHAAALHLLGAIAHRAGFTDHAIGLVYQAVQREPRIAAYRSNLGAMLCAVGHFDDAARACEEALALEPESFDGHFNLGNAFAGAGRFEEAAAAYRRALALRADAPEVHNNLGNALGALGEATEAVAAFRQALLLRPDYAHARSNLAHALEDLRRFAEAESEHRVAVDAAPGNPELQSDLIAGLVLREQAADIDRECERWDERHAAPLLAFVAAHPNDPAPDRVLRVGLVLPDRAAHDGSLSLLPMLRARDPSRLHVTGYALGAGGGDPASAALRESVDAWVPLAGATDEAAAQRIRADRIDILVDLAGHDRSNRLALFARRPAPVQLAGPAVAVTSARCIDGRLEGCIDGLIDDGASQSLAGVPMPPADRTQAPVTFGHRGSARRVGPSAAATWSAILVQLPEARLVVEDRVFRDPGATAAFVASFDESVRPRIQPVAETRSASSHSDAPRVDVVLDTLPLSNSPLVAAARAKGLPVVVIRAREPGAVGRWNGPRAADVARYVETAVAVGSAGPCSPGRAHAPPDDVRMARAFEAGCREAWHRWCASARR